MTEFTKVMTEMQDCAREVEKQEKDAQDQADIEAGHKPRTLQNQLFATNAMYEDDDDEAKNDDTLTSEMSEAPHRNPRSPRVNSTNGLQLNPLSGKNIRAWKRSRRGENT